MNSFKEIYDLYKHKVYFYVKKSIKNGDDIEDITQEVTGGDDLENLMKDKKIIMVLKILKSSVL